MDSSSARPLQITRVPLDSLVLDPANARSHNERNLESILASLRRFGQAEPLVVHAATRRVIGGNGRLVAMRQLGWTECGVVELDIDELQATALAIALNRTAELAEWDLPALGRLLDQLRNEDALVGVGFEETEVDDILAELAAEAAGGMVDDPGPEEPPETPVSRLGDLWALGQHRLLCGDSTDDAAVQRLLAGERAALLATDPPYCVDYTGADRPGDSGKDWSHVYREVDIADLGEFLDQVLEACLPHLESHTAIYVWHAHVQLPTISALFERHGLLLHQVLVWVKPTATFGHSYYHWRHEPCAFGWVKGNKPPHGPGVMDTVWEVDWEGKQRIVGNQHPTSKPVRVFEIPIEQHTKPGDLVLEAFSGSGSQILAAEKLGRRCAAMEIQPAFVDVAVRRWEQATGKDAVHEESGRTFAEVSAERDVG